MTASLERSAGYLELLTGNTNFRRLWLANVISLLGDWFNTLALYALVAQLTGSPLALGAVFICKMLPGALASPIAGIVVDRLNRRMLMIVSDLLRAVVVLCLVVVDSPGEVWLLYVLTALQVVLGSVFQPARSASMPMVASERELLTANTLMSVSWSVMLTLGAASGGFVTAWLGPHWVFVIDALTYLLSAWFLLGTRIPQETDQARHTSVIREATEGIVEGLRHLRSTPRILRIGMVKATFSLGGGGLIYLLALLGEQIQPEAPAIGMGILLAARGIGTGVGPVAARALFPHSPTWPRVIGASLALTGVFYALVGALPFSYWICLLVFIAHCFGGTQWVLSAVLLQQRTEDRYRGRVFASEWLLLLLADSLSIFVTSALIEVGVLSVRTAVLALGALLLLFGLLWSAWAIPAEQRERHAEAAVATGG